MTRDPSPIAAILHAFAAKLTELDRRNLLSGGDALWLQDPSEIAGHIHGLAHSLCMTIDGWGEDGSPIIEAIGAQCIAYLLARARVEELDITASDSEAQ